MKKVEIRRFRAKSDSGKEYIIIEYQQGHKTIRTGGGAPPSRIPRLPILLTSAGLPVNQIDSETFKVVPTDEIVRKV